MAVSPAGVRSAGQLATGLAPWSSMMKAVETDDFFLFYLSKINAVYLPKRHVTPDEVQAVRELTRARLGERFEERASAGTN